MDHTLLDINQIEFNHQQAIQIRFNDVDVIGHVNNAVQLSYFDLGKVKYFFKASKINKKIRDEQEFEADAKKYNLKKSKKDEFVYYI